MWHKPFKCFVWTCNWECGFSETLCPIDISRCVNISTDEILGCRPVNQGSSYEYINSLLGFLTVWNPAVWHLACSSKKAWTRLVAICLPILNKHKINYANPLFCETAITLEIWLKHSIIFLIPFSFLFCSICLFTEL